MGGQRVRRAVRPHLLAALLLVLAAGCQILGGIGDIALTTLDGGREAGRVDAGRMIDGGHRVDAGRDGEGSHDGSIVGPPPDGRSDSPALVESGRPGRDATPDVVRGLDACTTPERGLPCTPGFVPCGSVECAVPAHPCCTGTNGPTACLADGATCAGDIVVACGEAADCPADQICCIGYVPVEERLTYSCQAAPRCPVGEISAQACRSNQECGDGGTCSLWSCPDGLAIEACINPILNECTR